MKKAEPAFLGRLRRAVERSGLTVERFSSEEPQQDFLVRAELAQVTLQYLEERHAAAAKALRAELEGLGSADEVDLLVTGRGYTFFHVLHFLFEFGKHYGGDKDLEAGVGLAGGGLQEETQPEWLALALLLNTAMPAGDDAAQLPRLMQTLGTLALDRLFPSGAFALEVEAVGRGGLKARLALSDAARTRRYLQALGLEGDMGPFFVNSARQIEGTILIGLRKLVHQAEDRIAIGGRLGALDPSSLKAIAADLSCTWDLTWDGPVALRRLQDPEAILEQGRVIHTSQHRDALEYFQERVKSLEMKVRDMEAGAGFHRLVGSSPQIQRVFQFVEQVAPTELTVLIRGPSGTGKELVARAIHDSSPRRDRPFVAVNCAAFTETLLESELFGHEQGAFTGADRTKPGRFELADGGTLFLDEAGDIPLTTQVKLLRVLETRSFERVGGTRTIHCDLRFIAATNQDLEALIAQGRMREDFHFRLNVLPLHLPPLSQRPEDIPQLAQHFIEGIARRGGRVVRGLTRGAIRRLVEYPWPGNVRELQNAIERAVAVYVRGEVVTEADVSQALELAAPAKGRPSSLNLRQSQILRHISSRGEGCSVEDLARHLAPSIRGAGRSLRTLQNDLRKLDELGYVRWVKHGSARQYVVTAAGGQVLGGE